MHPVLFRLPAGLTITSYGFMMMVGFLTGVWLAMKRASRVKANPDVLLDLSFPVLVAGVLGARIFYVAHYWRTQFADLPNRWLAIIDIRAGGLEFLGGFLGATAAIIAYLLIKRLSLRMYLDIIAPAAMWGLAFGRIGCFLNGCCFGGPCTVPHGDEPRYAWAVRFPYGSPAHVREWEARNVTIPAELVVTVPEAMVPALLPAETLDLSVETRERPLREVHRLEAALKEARTEPLASEAIPDLERALAAAKKAAAEHAARHNLQWLYRAEQFPSRRVPSRPTSVSEIEALAARSPSLPVHPTQLYATINALLLCGLLTTLFHVRKRHGLVMGALLILYPVSRFILEEVRTDNPEDILGLTISQAVSVALFAVGVVYLVVLYRLPQRSPSAVPYIDPAPPPAASR